MSSPTLHIAAGSAFGSGEHPSTHGALLALEQLAAQGRRFASALDMGCGSGILSVAAATLFGCPVLATDIDAQAPALTTQNAEANGVGGLVRTLRSDGYDHTEIAASAPYGLITCNMLAELIIRFSADAARHLAPGGVIILSGILSWLEEDVRQAHARLSIQPLSMLELSGWRTLIAIKEG